MSYQNIAKKNKTNQDEESGNPLLAGNSNRSAQTIETKLNQIKQKIKTLETMENQIGSSTDSKAFRDRIAKVMGETTNLIKTCNNEIKEYKDLQVSQQETKQKQDRFKAFQESQQQMVKQFQNLATQIGEKQKMHADKVIQNVRDSMAVGGNDDSIKSEQNSLFNKGDDQKQVSLQVEPEQLQIKGESDYMEGLINQRSQDINNIANIMSDINAISKDIAVETHAQGEKLEGLQDNMTVADKNTEQALDQLKQAATHQKKGGRCMYLLVGTMVMCIIVVAIIIAS